MPGLKLLVRRTLATSAVNPSSILSPPPSPSSGSFSRCGKRRVFCVGGGRSRLARGDNSGACLRLVSSAQVKPQNIFLICNNNLSRNKRLFILSPPKYSSSSSSSSSSPPFEERESERKHKTTDTSSQHSGVVVADMGHRQNGVVERGFIHHQQHQDQNGKDHNHIQPQDGGKQEQECSRFLTLPTVLTLARVAAIPVFIATFYVNSWWGTAATTSIFIAAAITDWLDGYLARKMRQGTAFGAFLDPVADKLMVAATLVLLCSRPPETVLLGDLPWLFPVPAIAIIGREITMSAVREWAASQNTQLLQAVAVNNLGKWKTATQMTALTILVATRESSLAGSGILVTSGVALLYISAGLAVWSLVVYMKKISKVLLR